MKIPQFKYSLLLVLLIFFYGCSTIKIVNTDQTPDFTLKSYKTFNFYDIVTEMDTSAVFINRLALLEEEIESQFELKGVKQVDENPDLLVNLGIVLWESLDTREKDLISDGPQYKGGQNYKFERGEIVIGVYTEGSIVMHLVDAKSDILVWKGVVDGVMVKKDKSAQRNMRIGMEHLFKEIN